MLKDMRSTQGITSTNKTESTSSLGTQESPFNKRIQPVSGVSETMRLETALFNQFTKNYDLKKCLEQLEEGEIGGSSSAPPKTRIFLNLIKEFNLTSTLFFRDKTEKELVQEPDFLENDHEGQEKSYL